MLKTYKKLRKNKYNALLMDAVFIVLVLMAFSWWQNKGTLAAKGQLAPDFTFHSLTGDTYQLSDYRGRQVLVYFLHLGVISVVLQHRILMTYVPLAANRM